MFNKEMKMDTISKQTIIEMLRVWINQRPGLEFGNYGNVPAYRAELRQITKDRREAIELLRYVELRDSITADDLIAAFPRAFSGRLRLEQRKDGKWQLDYCTGQYWPTEYRKAACAVLAQVLWERKRADMPSPDAPTLRGNRGETYGGKSAGDWIRSSFRREFGRSIASRWFN
jgi:hypothetical protein